MVNYASKTSNPTCVFYYIYLLWNLVPGEKDTYVDRQHNIYRTKFLNFNVNQAGKSQKASQDEPYYLDDSRRKIVLASVLEVCKYKQWTLLAAHVQF